MSNLGSEVRCLLSDETMPHSLRWSRVDSIARALLLTGQVRCSASEIVCFFCLYLYLTILSSRIAHHTVNKWGFNRSTVAKLLACYPDDPYIGIPANTGAETYPASSSLHVLKILLGSWRPPSGTQDKRVFALMSDLICHAGNRFMAEQLAKHSVPIWKYRFNQIPWK